MARDTVTPPVGSAGRLDDGRPEPTRTPAGIVATCVGLLIALVLPQVPIWRSMGGGLAFHWSITGVLLAYILLVERRSVASIGLRLPTWKSFAFGIPVALILIVGAVVTLYVVFPALHRHMSRAALDNVLHTPWWLRFLRVTRAAVTEEVCYRGYTIERVQELTGRKWIAFVVSVAAFTYSHLGYFGWAYLIYVGFGGVVSGLYYLWRRDLTSNIIAHFVADGAELLTPTFFFGR